MMMAMTSRGCASTPTARAESSTTVRGAAAAHAHSPAAERERLRRTTIRSLFDSLRRSVPTLEGMDAVSDRQILMEAVQHIGQLGTEEAALEEGVLTLRIENMELRLATMCTAASADPLALIRDAALADELRAALCDARARLDHVRARTRSWSDAAVHTSPPQHLRAAKRESEGASTPECRPLTAAGPAGFDSLLSVANLALRDLPS